MEKEFDIIILGGGVGGMMAAIYAKRAGKNVAIIESMMLGGQVVNIQTIENFPSYPTISGFELIINFQKQLEFLKIAVLSDNIVKVDLKKEVKLLQGKKNNYKAKKVIIASGLAYNKIGVNEDNFLGRGVSYCVICDGHLYRDKTVCVASSKGSGILGALQLCDLCEKVILLDSEDMSKYASVCPKKNMQVVSNVKIIRINGKDVLSSISAKIGDEDVTFDCSALFVELGRKPSTTLYKEQIELDENGYIKTDEYMKTSLNGVYACGDARNGVLKQVVTACADGAIAGQFAAID